MQNPRGFGRPRLFANKRLRSTATALIVAGVIGVCGCGGSSISSSAPTSFPPPTTPVTPDASVTGQYSLLLTSSNGHGATNIYTNFTQTAKTFVGADNTLVCLANDLSKCEGKDLGTDAIAPSGTVSGANVAMMISFSRTAGTDSVTMVGTPSGTVFDGTYTDSLGDSGKWTASPWSSLAATYSGTFNLTANPLLIHPTISITLAQDASFHLNGTATILNSPCISSLTLSGGTIGAAFILTDPASKATIVALPSLNGLNEYNFSYIFDPTAAGCAGDFGRGKVSGPGFWDYGAKLNSGG